MDREEACAYADPLKLVMREVLNAHLRRVKWKDHFPTRLHPCVLGDRDMPIAIDPSISFGRPLVVSRDVSTAAIVGRIDAAVVCEPAA